jgi:hypothetical protein
VRDAIGEASGLPFLGKTSQSTLHLSEALRPLHTSSANSGASKATCPPRLAELAAADMQIEIRRAVDPVLADVSPRAGE